MGRLHWIDSTITLRWIIAMLRLNENVGDNGNNTFDASAFSVNFGLRGDDQFTSRSGSDFAVAIGGPGNDTYRVSDNSALTVADLGDSGGDALIADGIGLFSSTSYSAIINGQHFVAGDTASGQIVYVMDYRDPRQEIETLQLRDGTTSYAEVMNLIDSQGTTEGNISWSQIPNSGYTGAEVEEAIDFYEQRATDLLNQDGNTANERIPLAGQQGQIDAGDGLDTGVLNQPRSSYTVNAQDGAVSVSGGGVNVQLVNVERLEFTDGFLGFDERSERAYRLYEAALDRQPDAGGLGYWIDQLDQGADFNQVANSFIDSQEFRTLYGTSPSDDQFVDLIYQNVLERQPDPGGESYWTGALAQGMPRAEMLARFSDSEENRANVESQVDDGVFYL